MQERRPARGGKASRAPETIYRDAIEEEEDISMPTVRAGSLLRIEHQVGLEDTEACEKFYASLGIKAADGMVGEADAGLRVKFVPIEGGGHQNAKDLADRLPDARRHEHGYDGLVVRVPSVADALAAGEKNGGIVVRGADKMMYIGALIPEQRGEVQTNITEAMISDPAGYPVHLYEVAEQTPLLAGAQLLVVNWPGHKKFWEALGWTTVRDQSLVPFVAARTWNMAAQPGAPDPKDMGPRGAWKGPTEPVVQLRYDFGCTRLKMNPKGLAAIVLKAADGVSPQKIDNPPEGFPIVLE